MPIIENLKVQANTEFLVTTVTYSSGKLAEEKLKKFKNIHHRYFPVDITFVLEKFIKLWGPKAVFLVESEIWPNLIFTLKKFKIPLILINARITRKSYKRWKKVPSFSNKIFNSFDLNLASSLETKRYLEDLNAKNVYYTGNIKLIGNNDTNLNENINQKFLKKKYIWLAASTHNGEEILCIKTHIELKKKIGQIVTIIAPRHIRRVEYIKKLCDKNKLSSQILSKDDLINENKEIILINSFGSLPSFFKYIKSVFIGKSTLKKMESVGGQNPIEAVKLGCKVYHGPYVYNFKEIYQIFNKNNISKEINNEHELAENLILDFKIDPKDINRYSKVMADMEGKTLNDTMSKINNFLSNENL